MRVETLDRLQVCVHHLRRANRTIADKPRELSCGAVDQRSRHGRPSWHRALRLLRRTRDGTRPRSAARGVAGWQNTPCTIGRDISRSIANAGGERLMSFSPVPLRARLVALAAVCG